VLPEAMLSIRAAVDGYRMVEHTLFTRIGIIYLRLVTDSAGKVSGIRFLKVTLTIFSVLMLYSMYTHTQGVWIRRERKVNRSKLEAGRRGGLTGSFYLSAREEHRYPLTIKDEEKENRVWHRQSILSAA
jgi:hypothetical protein